MRDPPVKEFYKSLLVTYGVGAPVYLIMSLVGYWCDYHDTKYSVSGNSHTKIYVRADKTAVNFVQRSCSISERTCIIQSCIRSIGSSFSLLAFVCPQEIYILTQIVSKAVEFLFPAHDPLPSDSQYSIALLYFCNYFCKAGSFLSWAEI